MSDYLTDITSPAATEHPVSDPVDVVRHMTNVRNQIRTCTRCELHKTCNGPVPFRGPAPSPLCIVGEAPGSKEDDAGEPFIGPSGQLLDKLMLDKLGFDSRACLVCNAVSCFPNQGHMEQFTADDGHVSGLRWKRGKVRAPWPKEREACEPNLIAQLSLADSPIILILGRAALSYFRSDLNISVLHGRPMYWRGKTIFATFHPAAALRQMTYQRAISIDLSVLRVLLDNPQARWPETCVSCNTTEVDRCDDWGCYWCDAHAPKSVKR